VSGRVRDLALEDLDLLPAPCRGCVFWQTTGRGRGGAPSDPAAQDAWWQAVQLEWGVPGRGVWQGDRLVGYALFAPSVHVQRSRVLGPPASEDALVLATMWVDPAHRGGGLARHLLQVATRDAIAHDLEAVEAYGTVWGGAPDTPGGCLLTGQLLEHLGFRLHRADVETPLYRLQTARTARWAESVGSALGEVVAALSPRQRVPSRPVLETGWPGPPPARATPTGPVPPSPVSWRR
jgi:GNAT superfamily N-acetyltransferase